MESENEQALGRNQVQKYLDSSDKVPNIGGLSLIPVLLLLLIMIPIDGIEAIAFDFGFEINSDTKGLVITAIFLIIVSFPSILLLIKARRHPTSEKDTTGKSLINTKYNRKGDIKRKSEEIRSLGKISVLGRVLWFTSVIIGFLTIILYPFDLKDLYKFLTLAALLLWVSWNIYSTAYYKPQHNKRIVAWKAAIWYFFITEVPPMMSLGSVIIGTIIRDSPNTLNVIISLSLALAISGITVIFERGNG